MGNENSQPVYEIDNYKNRPPNNVEEAREKGFRVIGPEKNTEASSWQREKGNVEKGDVYCDWQKTGMKEISNSENPYNSSQQEQSSFSLWEVAVGVGAASEPAPWNREKGNVEKGYVFSDMQKTGMKEISNSENPYNSSQQEQSSFSYGKVAVGVGAASEPAPWNREKGYVFSDRQKTGMKEISNSENPNNSRQQEPSSFTFGKLAFGVGAALVGAYAVNKTLERNNQRRN